MKISLVVLLLGLAACTHRASVYARENTSWEQTKLDYTECQVEVVRQSGAPYPHDVGQCMRRLGYIFQ